MKAERIKEVQHHCEAQAPLSPPSRGKISADYSPFEGGRGMFGLFKFRNALNTVLFLLMVNFAFGQIICNKSGYTDGVYAKVPIRQPIDDGKDEINLSREDFIKNGISTVSVYSYCFDINLNNIEDSFLLYREQFDIQENKILKIKYGRRGSEDITEIYYNDIGQIIKEKNIYNNSNDRYYYYQDGIYETDYEYDSLHREIKKTEKEITRYLSKRDTIEGFDAKIDEYVYNSSNQKIEHYYVFKRETTKYFRTKRKPKTSCKYLHSFHIKWKYDSLSNLTEKIYFSENNEFQTKSNYFYDEQNKLIKQIDTSEYISRIYTYEYTDTGKIVETTHNVTIPNMMFKYTSYYNNDDKIVKYCHNNVYTSEEDCEEYFYFYDNDKLIKIIEKRNDTIWKTLYSYNEKGLLIEEQKSRDDKITNLTRYFYE